MIRMHAMGEAAQLASDQPGIIITAYNQGGDLDDWFATDSFWVTSKLPLDTLMFEVVYKTVKSK